MAGRWSTGTRVPGRGLLVGHSRRGVAGGHATGPATVAGARVGRGGGGTGQGIGPREVRAPVPGHQAAVRPSKGALPGPGEERVAAGDPVRPLQPLDGTAHAAGRVGCRVPECGPDAMRAGMATPETRFRIRNGA